MTTNTIPLTREQRRQVVEFYATQCAAEMPSDSMPKAEFFQDLHREEYRLRAMKGIEKVIPEADWTELVQEIRDSQSFERDPDAYMYARGIHHANKFVLKEDMNDSISALIDAAARY